MLNVEQVLADKYPAFVHKPPIIRRPTLSLLRKLTHEAEINAFLGEHTDAEGFDFVERVLEYFNFSYAVSQAERENIPVYGRVVIVANHPLGALDGLALLKMVGEVRRDVKIIANDVLLQFQPLAPLLLPIDTLTQTAYKTSMARIVEALRREEAVIVFPAGEVSRAGPTGIKDGAWHSGFMHFARRTNSPLLPIHVGGKNSALFYSLSLLYRPLGMLLLANEMFKQQAVTVPMRVGELIPLHRLDIDGLALRDKVKLLRKHLYRLSKNRKPIFLTEKSIAHPEDRQLLKKELKQAQLLGQTRDGKQIYLFDYFKNSVVIKEVGRLREIAFRKVGEGTGARRDLDAYDRYYRHLLLWDDEELEIVGAYRIGEAARIIEQRGLDGLYSSQLFAIAPAMAATLSQGIELGRSFVQPKYWGKRSLDYLWYGIGAYLKQHPQVRYMFGPVSLSNAYPQAAKDLLVYYYRHYYGGEPGCITANAPYTLSPEALQEARALFVGNDAREDFARLKEQLDHLGVTVPTLYKQYAELCEAGGVRFMDFSVDADFGYCIDGLVLVEVAKVKDKKRERYIGSSLSTAA